jgi:hypothetical protein
MSAAAKHARPPCGAARHTIQPFPTSSQIQSPPPKALRGDITGARQPVEQNDKTPEQELQQ